MISKKGEGKNKTPEENLNPWGMEGVGVDSIYPPPRAYIGFIELMSKIKGEMNLGKKYGQFETNNLYFM